MKAVKIAENIYWVGAVDWNRRTFHGNTYTTKRGTTYNAYLIIDDKITLVDTVMSEFKQEMIERINSIVSAEKINYIIANHVEKDHSGALPDIMKICPKAKIFGSAKCKDGLDKHYYGNWDFQTVRTGEKISLGKKTLTFLEAPMLHWPDSMFTYIAEDAVLMPNDAFGQHYASAKRFDDEVPECELMDEAAKYYANILWPFSPLVAKKIEDVKKLNLPIKVIAPSHGIIWRKDPMKIVNAYMKWAGNTVKPKAVIVYETMWGSTAKMASAIAEGLADNGIEVKLYDIAVTDRTEVVTEMMDAKGVIIGSSTHDNDLLSAIGGFLIFFKGLKPKNKMGFSFGSYGWAGGAVATIENELKASGVEIAMSGLSVKYAPSEDEIRACYNRGMEFAGKLK